MTDEAMSPLRPRMIEDMTIRKLAPKTQEGCRTVKNFAASIVRAPTIAKGGRIALPQGPGLGI